MDIKERTEFNSLKLQNELLKAEAVLNERALGDMSKEVCALNNKLHEIIQVVTNLTLRG